MDIIEKYKVWAYIIEFLDNVPEIETPRIIGIGYESIKDEMQKQMDNSIR